MSWWPLVTVCSQTHKDPHSTPPFQGPPGGTDPRAARPSAGACPVPSSASQAAEQGPLLPPGVRPELRRVLPRVPCRQLPPAWGKRSGPKAQARPPGQDRHGLVLLHRARVARMREEGGHTQGPAGDRSTEWK